MRRVRTLLLACAGVVALWVITWVVASARGARCNPDDVTGCDTLGSILLWLWLGLPIVLVVLLSFVMPDIVASIARHLRSRRHPRNR
jgi:heme/copper-type cytochrome/quinol oxidase subunit 2